jgi:hypothetical protein
MRAKSRHTYLHAKRDALQIQTREQAVLREALGFPSAARGRNQ